jgi:hypothetical protein
MSDINPYESPDDCEEVGVATAADVEQWERGLYRKDNQLVMHKMAHLPDRCVKTNKPAGGRRVCRHFMWVHPLIFLTLPLAGVVFLILIFVLQKRATIYLGLSDESDRKCHRVRSITWWALLTIAAITVGSWLIAASTDGRATWAALGAALGAVTFVVCFVYREMSSQLVRPVRITDTHVWLKGVHPDYLADLPPWPYQP